MEPWRRYINEYWWRNHRWANWLPHEDRDVGWYGTIEDDQFRYEGALSQLGVKFTVKSDRTTGSPSFTSSAGVDISFKGKASAPGVTFKGLTRAEVGFKASFSSGGAVVMQSRDSRGSWIEMPRQVRRQIIHLIIKGMWDQDWWYLESVTRAKSGIVLMSEAAGGEILVNASAAVPNAKAKIGFQVLSVKGAIQQYPMNDGWVPEFVAVRVRYGLWDRLKDLFGSRAETAARLESLAATRTLRVRKDVGLSLGLDNDVIDALFTSEPVASDDEGRSELVGTGSARR